MMGCYCTCNGTSSDVEKGTTATRRACVYCAWQARFMAACICCASWISRPVTSLRGSCKKKCRWLFDVRMRLAPISIRKNPKIATAVLESGSTRGSPSYGKDQRAPQAGEQIEQGPSPPEPCGKRSRPSCEDREQLSIPIGSERLWKWRVHPWIPCRGTFIGETLPLLGCGFSHEHQHGVVATSLLLQTGDLKDLQITGQYWKWTAGGRSLFAPQTA